MIEKITKFVARGNGGTLTIEPMDENRCKVTVEQLVSSIRDEQMPVATIYLSAEDIITLFRHLIDKS